MSDEPTHKLTPFEALVLQRLDSMDGRLKVLEQKAFDTKPIWERALAELLELKTETLGVKEQIEVLNAKFELLNENTIEMRVHHRRLEKRVSSLEESEPL